MWSVGPSFGIRTEEGGEDAVRHTKEERCSGGSKGVGGGRGEGGK